jgi:hypothetical protein
MNDLIEPEQLLKEDIGTGILNAHSYWSKRRILFNILVGISGIIAVLMYGMLYFTSLDLFWMIAWGIVANGLYSFGCELDMLVIRRSGGSKSIKSYRGLLFWSGTILYILAGFAVAYDYYSFFAFVPH